MVKLALLSQSHYKDRPALLYQLKLIKNGLYAWSIFITGSNIFPAKHTRLINNNSGWLGSAFLVVISAIFLHKLCMWTRNQEKINV